MKLFAGLSAGTGKRRTGLEVLCDLAHEPLERELADQELSAAGGRRLSTAHTLIGSRSGGEASGFYPAHLWGSPLLVLANLTECDGTRPVAVRFLDAARSRCALARGFCGQLLARRLAPRGLARCLLCTRHYSDTIYINVEVRGYRARTQRS